MSTPDFKDHFSGHAADYRLARPLYPDALFDWLAAAAPARALAWDAGCGNGQASVALARRFERVIATDPSAQQIAHAEPHPRVDYRAEPAEASSLVPASTDLITAAQAYHWFDHARFHAEVRRVARPGALVAAWTYALCAITPAVDAVIEPFYSGLVGPYWPPERRHTEDGYARLIWPLDPVAPPPCEMRVDWTPPRFLAYLRTWSAVQRYEKAHGEDPVQRIEADLLRAWGGDADQPRAVRWPLAVRAGRIAGRGD